jgi:hypothetical protein
MRRIAFVLLLVMAQVRAARADDTAVDLTWDEAMAMRDRCKADAKADGCGSAIGRCRDEDYPPEGNWGELCADLGMARGPGDASTELVAAATGSCAGVEPGAACRSLESACRNSDARGWAGPNMRKVCEVVNQALSLGLTFAQPDKNPPPPPGPEAPVNGPLDEELVRPVELEHHCDIDPIWCKEARDSCIADVERDGGWLPASHRGDNCRTLGIPGEVRDLTAREAERLEAFCPTDPAGPACSSMRTICEEHAHSLAYPTLATGCDRVLAAETQLAAAPVDKPTPGLHEVFLGLATGRYSDRDAVGGNSFMFALDVASHETMGTKKTGAAWATDLALGSTSSGGFLYGFSLRLGLGVRVGELGQIVLSSGGGFDGITGKRLGFAWNVPVDLFAAIPIGAVRATVGVNGRWLFTEDPRQSGTTALTLFDEATVRVGVMFPLWGVQAFVSEVRDTRLWGISVGFADAMIEK